MSNRIMFATKAMHLLGDISRDTPNYALVTGEDGDNYIGNWMEGFGFANVRFPKSTTRALTEDEQKVCDEYFKLGVKIV